MKKALIIATLTALLGTLNAGGRGNVVTHWRDGLPDEILASRGNCRHHLSAHPGDTVRTTAGEVGDPAACN